MFRVKLGQKEAEEEVAEDHISRVEKLGTLELQRAIQVHTVHTAHLINFNEFV